MEDVTILKRKQKWLKSALSKVGGIAVSSDIPKWSYTQALLSMGDRRVGEMLLLAHRYGGNWNRALRSSTVNPDFFVYRPRGLEELLPWDFIDNGISKKHLIREYHLAMKAEESEVCRVGACARCGVCSSGRS